MRNDPETLDWHLLVRHLTGDLSPAETEAAERWLNADPRHRAMLEELQAVWQLTRGETEGWDTDRAVAALRRRVAEADRAAPLPTPLPRAPRSVMARPARRRRSWLRAAAAAAAVVAGVGVFRMAPWDAAPQPVAAVTEFATARGQLATVKLPDGSRVTLAPASTLRYDDDFGRRHRTVDLVGEAYFVAEHEGPGTLAVRTADGLTRDIGTAFVVRAYPAASTQVVVTEGVVVLSARDTADDANGPAPSARDSLLLEARQLGRVLPTGELESVADVDPADYLAWTRGRLVFEDTRLDDVVRELGRWYDADVDVANPRVAGRRFTGSFARGAIEDAVHLIAAVSGVSVRQMNGAWVFE